SIMQSSEFRRIEKAARTLEIECRKIAGPLVPEAEGALLLRRAKRAVHCGKAPERPRDAESRFGDRVDHQACLVSVFRGRPAGYDLERLNGIDRQLCRESFTLLVVDRLVVQRHRHLRVISKR